MLNIRILWASALFAATLTAQPKLTLLNHGHPIPDAHNCYPYEGRWADRIDRALSIGFPISIEQDLAWYVDPATGLARLVIVHNPKAITGSEPGLREHFLERVRPVVENALRQGNRDQWPLIVLHLDFKTNDAPLLHGVWDLLGEYGDWITTAQKGADSRVLAPMQIKPILVLTEDSDAQEAVFFNDVPVGKELRLFGSAHLSKIPGKSDRERAHMAATLAPEVLLTEHPTNYRRWWNNSWAVVEEGGQAHAGDWTAADSARLRSLVQHAHSMGFWSRFYTLDGFGASEDRGWDANYNFGALDAARVRWKAATDSGVDFISTDQYEELAKTIGRPAPSSGTTPHTSKIQLIAHRGGIVDSRYAENSPASLEAAVTDGYWMVETDLRETKDGHIVTQHDPDFVRFYGDSRTVRDLTLDQIQALRATPGGTPPMAFAELVDRSKGKIRLMLDIKEASHPMSFYREIEKDLDRTGLLNSAYFIDLPAARAYFKGKARVSATFPQLQEAVSKNEDVKRLYFLFEWGRTLTEEQVRFAQQHGVPVVPSVNTFHYERDGKDPIAAGAADIQRLKLLGVTEFQIDSVYQAALR